MTRILLTGAGFTKNWGGLVASEFFSRLLGQTLDDDVRSMLLKNRNFETVMATLQGDYTHSKSDHALRRLERFTSAVLGIFNGMNNHIARTPFEFDNDVNHSVTKFLQRFDAIFTLNQDGLLEMHYFQHFVGSRWTACELPGMKHFGPPSHVQSFTPMGQLTKKCPAEEYRPHPQCQPYFKLHGSANWVTDARSGPLLILGGQKSAQLGLHPILTQYQTEFRGYLNRPGVKMMIVGYGFGDDHINDLILDGVNNQLKIFVVDPDGIDVFDMDDHTAAIPGPPHPFTEALQKACIGESREPLSFTFGPRGGAERDLLYSFF